MMILLMDMRVVFPCSFVITLSTRRLMCLQDEELVSPVDRRDGSGAPGRLEFGQLVCIPGPTPSTPIVGMVLDSTLHPDLTLVLDGMRRLHGVPHEDVHFCQQMFRTTPLTYTDFMVAVSNEQRPL